MRLPHSIMRLSVLDLSIPYSKMKKKSIYVAELDSN